MLLKLSLVLKNNVLGALLSYLFTIYLANTFGPTEFGSYSLIIVWSNFLTLIIMFSTDNTAARMSVVEPSIGTLVGQITSFRVVNLVFVLIVSILYAVWEDERFIFVSLTFVSCVNLSYLYELRDKVARYSYIYLFERMGYVVISVALVYLTAVSDIKEVFYIYFLVTGLSVLFQVKDNHQFFVDFEFDFTKWKALLLRNLPVFISSMALFAYGGYSRMVLESVKGPTALGLYSAAWQFVFVGTLFQAAIDRVWRVELTKSISALDKDKLVGLGAKYIIFTTIPMFVIAISLALFGKTVVDLVYSEEYSEIYPLLTVVGFYLTVINLSGFNTICWIAIDKAPLYAALNVLTGFICLLYLILRGEHLSLVAYMSIVVGFHLFTVIILLAVFIYFFTALTKEENTRI